VLLLLFLAGFVLLACLYLVCTVKKRKSRVETVTKPLEITESAHIRRIGRSKMDRDLLTTARPNTVHESYRNLNEIPSYRYQMPILGNVEYRQGNGIMTMCSPRLWESPRFYSPKFYRNSSPAIYFNNNVHTFEPTNENVTMNMGRPRTLTEPVRPSNMVGGQVGSPPHYFCGLQPTAGESIHYPMHSYDIQLRDAGGGKGEIFKDEIVTIPSVRICKPNEGKYTGKSISRGWNSCHPEQAIHRESTWRSKQKRIGHRSQGGIEYMSNNPASPPLSEKRFFRKNRKEKKVKRRKSRKRSLKKSIS